MKQHLILIILICKVISIEVELQRGLICGCPFAFDEIICSAIPWCQWSNSTCTDNEEFTFPEKIEVQLNEEGVISTCIEALTSDQCNQIYEGNLPCAWDEFLDVCKTTTCDTIDAENCDLKASCKLNDNGANDQICQTCLRAEFTAFGRIMKLSFILLNLLIQYI